MVLPRDFRLALVVMVCALLAGCANFSLQDTRLISPPSEECTAERYLPAIENLRDIPTGIYPEGMQRRYGPLAAEILALPPISQGRCEIEFAFGRYPNDQYTATLAITEEQSSLCIRHQSFVTKESQGPELCLDR
jgi:hypothetical protein